MTNRTYYAPQGGLPPQTALLTDRAVFTESYAVIPKGVLRDITVSYFPFWEKTRAWVSVAAPVGICRNIFAIHHGREAGGRQRQAGA